MAAGPLLNHNLKYKKMGILRGGPFGIIYGKVGNLIGYNNGGRQGFRKIPAKSSKLPTAAQLEQRMRLALVVMFLSPLKSIVSKGFGNKLGKRSQMAQCVSYHTKHAVIGKFPDLEINYSNVLLTKGRLYKADNVEVFSSTVACLNITWSERIPCGISGPNDEAMLVAYNHSKHKYEFLRTTSDRASQCATLNLPIEFSGDRVHCWMLFISPNGKEFSPSTYIGSVAVA